MGMNIESLYMTWFPQGQPVCSSRKHVSFPASMKKLAEWLRILTKTGWRCDVTFDHGSNAAFKTIEILNLMTLGGICAGYL